MSPAGRRGLIFGGVAALAAAIGGAAAGMALERALIGRVFRPDDDEDEPYGQLRGMPLTVLADDGTALHAEVDLPEDSAAADLTIVYTHGYTLNQDCWHFQRRDLRQLARQVFWDQRSHGRSGRGAKETHTIDQLGRDLMRIIEDCAPQGPLILVGHSMGGMTIMALADQHPELFGDRVLGVALIATSSGGMKELTLGLPKPAAGLLHSRSAEVSAIMSARKEALERGRTTTSDLSYLMTKALSFGGPSSPRHTQFIADMIASTPIDVVAEFLPQFDTHDKVTALAALQGVETLVMVGERDLLTPRGYSDEIVRHLPGAQLVVLPATGHMIMSERYPEVNLHLRELVAAVRSTMGE